MNNKSIKVSSEVKDWLSALRTKIGAPSINEAVTMMIIHLNESEQVDSLIERGQHCFLNDIDMPEVS